MGWEGFKEFYNSKLNNYSKFIKGRDQPLPPWSDSDVNEFIASHPLHGPALKTARETAKIAAVGSFIGAISIAGTSWKYSRSPHGAVLSLGFGAVVGWTFGKEIANHYLQTYRVDTMGAQVKFLEWWEKKNEGRSSESSFL